MARAGIARDRGHKDQNHKGQEAKALLGLRGRVARIMVTRSRVTRSRVTRARVIRGRDESYVHKVCAYKGHNDLPCKGKGHKIRTMVIRARVIGPGSQE